MTDRERARAWAGQYMPVDPSLRLVNLFEHAILDEREACAKALKNLFPRSDDPGWIVKHGIAQECVVAIRKRG